MTGLAAAPEPPPFAHGQAGTQSCGNQQRTRATGARPLPTRTRAGANPVRPGPEVIPNGCHQRHTVGASRHDRKPDHTLACCRGDGHRGPEGLPTVEALIAASASGAQGRCDRGRREELARRVNSLRASSTPRSRERGESPRPERASTRARVGSPPDSPRPPNVVRAPSASRGRRPRDRLRARRATEPDRARRPGGPSALAATRERHSWRGARGHRGRARIGILPAAGLRTRAASCRAPRRSRERDRNRAGVECVYAAWRWRRRFDERRRRRPGERSSGADACWETFIRPQMQALQST